MTADEVVAIVSSLWGLDLARCLKGTEICKLKQMYVSYQACVLCWIRNTRKVDQFFKQL